jgi:hypothetical protein
MRGKIQQPAKSSTGLSHKVSIVMRYSRKLQTASVEATGADAHLQRDRPHGILADAGKARIVKFCCEEALRL